MMSNAIPESMHGYTAEIDAVSEPEWYEFLSKFDDANIYQTWAYAAVVGNRRRTSHLVLKLQDEVVAIAQIRIKAVPLVRRGIAYVQWGPLWRLSGREVDTRIFRQAICALRSEYVTRRGLTLRLFPAEFEDDASMIRTILSEEGFSSTCEACGRTILLNLAPSLDELRNGMHSHWKRELKVAERNHLEVIEGDTQDLFESVICMYREMVLRKRFAEPNDIDQFRQIQARLPAPLKMRVLVCKSAETPCSGAIYSLMGDSAVYLFGTTSNAGLKSRGSYVLQWKIIEALKQRHAERYNLNGINPAANPGTYKFKRDLAGVHGREAVYIGRVDMHPGAFTGWLVSVADRLRKARRAGKTGWLAWVRRSAWRKHISAHSLEASRQEIH